MVSQVTLFAETLPKCLDLLNIVDLKESGVGRTSFEKEGDENSPLRMRMDTAAGIALLESRNEEGSAL